MRVSGRVVTPDGVIDGGYVQVDGTRITRVGRSARARGCWLVPGFVDIHVHGGGGHTFTTGNADAARLAVDFHRRHGTTTMLASLVSSPYDLMYRATAAFTPLVAAGVLAGIHFEGPYLSVARCARPGAVAGDVEEHLLEILPAVARDQVARRAAIDDPAAPHHQHLEAPTAATQQEQRCRRSGGRCCAGAALGVRESRHASAAPEPQAAVVSAASLATARRARSLKPAPPCA